MASVGFSIAGLGPLFDAYVAGAVKNDSSH
jgi:hypothetical protein